MMARTRRETVVFLHPFLLKGVGRTLPAGNYEVLTDDELIEGLSFPVYRRMSTMMLAPSPRTSAVEMLTIDPGELRAALNRDAAAGPAPGRNQNPQTGLL